MADGHTTSPATPDKSQEIVDHVSGQVTLTDVQKVELKNETAKVINKVTGSQLDSFKTELVSELKKKNENDKDNDGKNGIEVGEIGEAINTVHEKIITPKTPADTVKDKLMESATIGLSAVVWEKTADAIMKDVQVGGFMTSIKKFIYEISKFFGFLSGSKNTMSYETNEIYTNCIEKQLRDAGILSPLTAEWKPEKWDIAAGSQFMWKISALGIPLEYADLYLPFVTNSITDITKIPSKLQSIFKSWKAHFATLGQPLDNSDPQRLIDSMFDFKVVEETPAAPAGASAASAETAPATPAIELIKVTVDGKEVSVEASPESIAIFKKIQKSAETILGKDKVGMEKVLKAAYEANTETDPKKKWEAVLRSVAIELAKQIRGTTAILWEKQIDEVEKDGKKISIADDSFTGDLLPAIDAKLQAYIPLAFKELSNKISTTVKNLLTDLDKKVPWLKPEEYKKIQETIQKSVIGSYIEAGQVNSAAFVERTKSGYDEVMRDILKQAEKLKAITPDNLPDILKVFLEKSPLELS